MPDPLEDFVLSCTRYRCGRRVVACVVFVGPSHDGRPGWRIEPTCRKHFKLHEDTARRVRQKEYPGIYRHHPNMTDILDWIHADAQRCSLDSVSVRGSQG